MKSLLFLVLIFLAFGLTAQSFRGGVQVGFPVSQINGDGRGGYDKANLMAGIFIEREYRTNASWGFEMYYTGKGSVSTVKYANGLTIQEFKNSFHYLEMPLMLKYRMSPKVRIGGGLAAAYYLTGKFVENGSEIYEHYYLIHKVDVAPIGILEYQFSEKLCGDVRLYHSLLFVSDRKPWRHNVLTFALKFKLKQ